jgi:hypothetical protein
VDGTTHKPVVIPDGRDGQIFTIMKTDFNIGLQGEATKTEAFLWFQDRWNLLIQFLRILSTLQHLCQKTTSGAILICESAL